MRLAKINRYYFSGLALLLLFSFVLVQPAIADRNLVNDPDTMGGGQNVYAEISTQRDGNFLNTPESFAKLSFESATGNKFRIGYCQSSDRSCGSDESTGKNVRVEVCPLNAAETAVVAANCRIFDKQASGRDIAMNITGVRSTVNDRFNYRFKVTFINSTLGKPVIPFRLRAVGNGASAGFFNHRGAGGGATPIAIQNRNNAYTNTNHKDNLTIRFRIPCISSVPNQFTIRWKDADATANSTPANTDINWSLTLKDGVTGNTKGAYTSAGLSGGAVGTVTHSNWMGGQGEDRDSTLSNNLAVPYAAGDIFEWKWNNVLTSNGVQFEVPFDDANIRNKCTQSEADNGTCSIDAPERLAINERFGASFNVRNTGTDIWSTIYTKMGSSRPNGNTNWGVDKLSISGGGVEATVYGPVLRPGQSTSWTTASNFFTARSTPGAHTFSWRIFREEQPLDNGVDKNRALIDECSVTIIVYDNTNYPFVRATTNDVWAGAQFSQDLSGTCQYDPAGTAAVSANARIRTYTSGNLGEYDRAVVKVARLWRAVLGRSISNASTTKWFDDMQTAEDDQQVVQEFLDNALNDNNSNSTNIAKISNNGLFLDQLYRNAFGREPDPTGKAGWLSAMTSGMPRRQVVNAFLNSGDSAPFSLSESALNNYGGSGSEYGVFSTGQNVFDTGLDGFVGRNGIVRNNNNALRFDLVFANNADAYSADDEVVEGQYGSFSAQPYCMTNYYQVYEERFNTINNNTNVVSSANIGSRLLGAPANAPLVLKSSSNLTIPATTLASGSNVTLIVDGDVTITGNILYPLNYGAGAAPSVPKFTLISKGNITIDSTTTALDGVYIAQPRVIRDSVTNLWAYDDSATAKGVIQTCDGGAVQNTPNGTCATSPLRVNGSLIARRLRLWRTYGSIGASFNGQSPTMANTACATLGDYKSNNPEAKTFLYGAGGISGTVNTCAAEYVNASAERYLSGTAANSTSAAQSYKELPPIY